MQAHEMMITNVYKVNETDTVRTVIKNFIEHRISGMPVVNEKAEITGYISDGDIMRYIGKHKDIVVDSLYMVNIIKGDEEAFDERIRHILDLNVLDVAKTDILSVEWDAENEDVAAILGEKRIKKLPVVRDGKLAGIISRGDVIRHTFQAIL